MPPISLTFREIRHRWRSSLVVVFLVCIITGMLTFFSVNRTGFEREMSRNARDIGSNVVILPADVDQFQYHAAGGFSDSTMPAETVQQIIEYKASLNHLIPMLERHSECTNGSRTAATRIVGITASIPMPGRPKAPMQKSIKRDEAQLGFALAKRLGIERDETPTIEINGNTFRVRRINRANGTWQDSAAFIDLKTAQSVFELPGRISRIEAIECTDERCAETGLKSNVVLANELAQITDQALILRREKMASARKGIRDLSQANVRLIQNTLWILLAAGIMGLASLNSVQRRSEIGVLQSLGYGQTCVVSMFVARAILLTFLGSVIGVVFGAIAAFVLSRSLFLVTANKYAINWPSVVVIVVVATVLAAIASSLPVLLATLRPPADLIGKEG